MSDSVGKTMRVLAAGVLLGALVACEKNDAAVGAGPAERAGEQLDQAAARAGEGLNKAAEKAGEGMQSMGEKLQNKAEDAQKKD